MPGPHSESRASLREHLREAPFALAMSSGFFSFFAHTGFLTVLEDEGLVPSRVSGSSAGALVTGAWASGLDAPALATELEQLERRDFWDPGVGAGFLRGRLFRERLERLLPTHAFHECRVPAAVSVFEVRGRRTHVLSSGDLTAAIHASCAVPVLFHPVPIAGLCYLDGGILDRPGLAGMPESEPRVLFHHIAAKSAWRTKLAVPRRPGMVTVVLEGLPRSGPFRLDAGRAAFRAARAAMKRALNGRIADGVVIAA
jgi:NTE family protein